MAADVSKHLDRAQRCLEKNRIEDAVEAYLAVLDEAPNHQEATQALGDLYTKLDQPDRASVYYGMLFDLLVEPRDESKALAIYSRFLRPSSVQQPPERMARYGFLLQKQNRPEEAVEQYSKAADQFLLIGRSEDALFCYERCAQLEPENISRQLRVAEAAANVGKSALAARAFLRAGQLASVSGAGADALKLLGRAHDLAPNERSVSLLYAEAKLRAGQAAEAAKLLEPFASAESDAAFLETYGEALTRSSQLDRARGVLERLLREKNAGASKLFDLAGRYAQAKQDSKAVEIFLILKRRMFADGRENDFAAQLDGVAENHPDSQAILEFWGAIYSELNRESKYFEILMKLFDRYANAGNYQKAREMLERLVDIDPYDSRSQERLERLRGHVDDSLLKNLAGRLSHTVRPAASTPTSATERTTPTAPAAAQVTDEARVRQTLEDLIVQTEIFLQYSLHAKAMERLQKIAATYPGEEERNARLHNLYELANWWPAGAKPKPAPSAPSVKTTPAEAQPLGITGKTGVYTAETLRDLTKISEITQKIYRQQTPRTMLSTAVNEVGNYLRAERALAVVGAPGRPPEMAAEFCAPGIKPAPGAQVVHLIAQMEKSAPDSLGGLIVEAAPGSVLSDLGLATALGVVITDKETQTPAGMLIVGHTAERQWKPNETYFLQAIGDQMLMSVSHTRLRSLVRRMGVSDERTGLLSRNSYVSCLMTEADRARSQGTPLSLAILQIDRGAELIRQHGESPLERCLEQLARSLQPIVRQNDVAVKYTAWSLAFVLPDTAIAGARNLTDKLRRAAAGVHPPWDGAPLTVSAAIVEAVAPPDYDCEDIVTDLINRAEMSLEEARRRGGDTVVTLDSPKT